MKKTLSIVLALCLALSCLFTCLTASAEGAVDQPEVWELTDIARRDIEQGKLIARFAKEWDSSKAEREAEAAAKAKEEAEAKKKAALEKRKSLAGSCENRHIFSEISNQFLEKYGAEGESVV